MYYRRHYVASHEYGLVFRERDLVRVLPPGRHTVSYATGRTRVWVVSCRDPWVRHPDIDVIVRSGLLSDLVTVYRIADSERALVWVDGLFDGVLTPGVHACWNAPRHVEVERHTITDPYVRSDHGLDAVLVDMQELNDPVHPAMEWVRTPDAEENALGTSPAARSLVCCVIPVRHAGLLYRNGVYVTALTPGRHVFWKQPDMLKCVCVSLQQAHIDLQGQELLSADRVPLRMNTLVVYEVVNPRQWVEQTQDPRDILYRLAQLALRECVGKRTLDDLLTDRNGFTACLMDSLAQPAEGMGVRICQIGLRDIILPGEIREAMQRVLEAKQAAEANLITRREEIAALRAQANAAQMLAGNPVLMRLRQLEMLERIAQHGQLRITLSDQTITDALEPSQ